MAEQEGFLITCECKSQNVFVKPIDEEMCVIECLDCGATSHIINLED